MRGERPPVGTGELDEPARMHPGWTGTLLLLLVIRRLRIRNHGYPTEIQAYQSIQIVYPNSQGYEFTC